MKTKNLNFSLVGELAKIPPASTECDKCMLCQNLLSSGARWMFLQHPLSVTVQLILGQPTGLGGMKIQDAQSMYSQKSILFLLFTTAPTSCVTTLCDQPSTLAIIVILLFIKSGVISSQIALLLTFFLPPIQQIYRKVYVLEVLNSNAPPQESMPVSLS